MNNRAQQTETAARAPQRFLRRDMTVRQVAHDFPACRDVFVRHHEPADRTPFGHLEPLEKFANRHHVPLDQLMDELARAAGVPVDRRGPAANHVHRMYVIAALAITLTIGAGWGAWLLWRIGLSGDFALVSSSHIVAHGDAQLWGFVGFFIAGVALRWLPTATATSPVRRGFAAAIWLSLLAGIVGGFVWALQPAALAWVGRLSGGALLVAAALMAGFFFRRVGPRLPQPWTCAVSAAGLWWVVWAAFTLWLRCKHATTGPAGYSLAQRNGTIELAVFGLAVNAVYGFGLRLLPGIVGGSVKQPRANLAIALHNVGLLLLPLSYISSQPSIRLIATSGIAAGAMLFVFALPGLRRLKQFSTRPEQGPSELSRYVQLAIFWLVVGALLLLSGQAYGIATRAGVPHAWRGAARHALTVGFLTTLIMGVAQRLLPILGHTRLAWPRLVLPILVLVACGNFLRVTTELATLVWPMAFWIMPISSLLELAALILFAHNCLQTMWSLRDPLLTTGRVTPQSSVALLLAEYPWLEDQLIADGFEYLRRTRSVPRELTIVSMCRSHGRDPDQLVDRINELLARSHRSE